jgi:hypothetical protein
VSQGAQGNNDRSACMDRAVDSQVTALPAVLPIASLALAIGSLPLFSPSFPTCFTVAPHRVVCKTRGYRESDIDRGSSVHMRVTFLGLVNHTRGATFH